MFGLALNGLGGLIKVMRRSLVLLSIIACSQIKAQQITGLWFSGDSSRVYEIKEAAGNTFEAVIKSSSRKADSTGFIVIKAIQFNRRKNRYEGIMYAISDNRPCLVKLNTVNNRLVLKLKRMFLFDATLNWNQVNTVVAD